jgi:hypothetical protein
LEIGLAKLGLIQYLCFKTGIEMVNGDMSEAEEYQFMFKNYDFEHCLLLYSIERFVNMCIYGVYPNITIEQGFKQKFIEKQLKKYKIKIEPGQ